MTVNLSPKIMGSTSSGDLIALAEYAVVSLPTGSNGLMAYATDGRKSGEGGGAGTGCVVVFSNTKWRRLSDETEVVA